MGTLLGKEHHWEDVWKHYQTTKILLAKTAYIEYQQNNDAAATTLYSKRTNKITSYK